MKKITKEELNELKRRYSLVNQSLLTADALNLHTKQYTNKLLVEKGYNVQEKAYNIDLNSGKVTEVKEEKKQ
jgi:hypothetical protein